VPITEAVVGGEGAAGEGAGDAPRAPGKRRRRRAGRLLDVFERIVGALLYPPGRGPPMQRPVPRRSPLSPSTFVIGSVPGRTLPGGVRPKGYRWVVSGISLEAPLCGSFCAVGANSKALQSATLTPPHVGGWKTTGGSWAH